MRTLFAGALVMFMAALAVGQAAPRKLEFEVASIRPSQQTGSDQVSAGVRMDGAQAHFGALSLEDLMRLAYRVEKNQISGPEWLESQRFDVSAKLPDGATTEQIPEMLQSLLAQRFQLKLHHEMKDMSAYALVLGKSPLKLKELPPDSAPAGPNASVNVSGSGSAAGIAIDMGNGTSYTFANNEFQFHKFSMDQLATQMARYLDRPIVNLTGLKGNYDLTLDVAQQDYYILLVRSAVNSGVTLNPGAMRLLDAGPPESLFDSLDQQGLHVDSRKMPVDMIVVDSALQTPTDN